MTVTENDFALLADVVHRRSGLMLPPGKRDFVQSKLAPLAMQLGFKGVDAMLAELADEPEELASAVTEAMTINETSFFRDPACFEHFRKEVLPALMAARAETRRLRVWCAAAATGQEAYSLAMLVDEAGLAEAGWKIDLFATDLSAEAIARLREGVYTRHEVQRGLPLPNLARYFTPDGDRWRIAETLRRSLRVRPFNLLDHFGWLGVMDVIFCRNVLIYFDQQTKRETLTRLAHCLAPDGWLAVGATEYARDCEAVVPAHGARGLYVKAGNAAGRQTRLAG